MSGMFPCSRFASQGFELLKAGEHAPGSANKSAPGCPWLLWILESSAGRKRYRSELSCESSWLVLLALMGNLLTGTSRRAPFSIHYMVAPPRQPHDKKQDDPMLAATDSAHHATFGSKLASGDPGILHVEKPDATPVCQACSHYVNANFFA